MQVQIIQNAKSWLKKKSTAMVALTTGKEVIVRQEGSNVKIEFGYGEKKTSLNRRTFPILCRKIVNYVKKHEYKNIILDFNDFKFKHLKFSDEAVLEIMGTDFLLACYAFNTYKKKPKKGWPKIDNILILAPKKANLIKALEKGVILGEEMNKCRELTNTPACDLTPDLFVKNIKKQIANLDISIKVLGKAQIEKEKMGAFLAVAQGSCNDPKFLILEYSGGTKKSKPIVLLGKGVTYDTGGLSLKPSSGMLGMHEDMSGAAAVIFSLTAAVRMKLKKNIIALIPLAENAISDRSVRPSDIIQSMSGKTIEITNTDAEGRLVLADTVTYSLRYDSSLLVTIASLTGGAPIAVGEWRNAIFASDRKLEDFAREIGDDSTELCWPLPLDDEFDELLQSDYADIVNSSKKRRVGHASQGAAFINSFREDKTFLHIDIAPAVNALQGEALAPGSKATGVRFTVKLLEKY